MRLQKIPLRGLILELVFSWTCHYASAQTCPYNIDFETGTFDGWQCYIGTADTVNGVNVLELHATPGPVFNRQTMYTANTGAGVDPYGGFPVNCPNGSSHSIRLGNDSAGGQAEGISYQFTIPPGSNNFSLIYHYAVVFQDPNHAEYQQPRLEIEVTNVTDHKTIGCSSFTFIPYGTILPGFFKSPLSPGGTPVWCKNWSAVSVNLDGNAGKTIQLFFKTGDCTFRKHFGYAYIDVNTECSSDFVGSDYCRDDTAVNLTAPFGYERYTWYDHAFSTILGTQQTLTFRPPPPPGSSFAVVVVPYDGYGCVDTLTARMEDSLTVTSRAGRDTVSCNGVPVPVGNNAIPGLVYSWKPVSGLSDPAAANPVAAPASTTTYVLTTTHDGGGCLSVDSVVVTASEIDSSIRLGGSPVFCTASGDSAVLHVHPETSIRWFRNDTLTGAVNIPDYPVQETGSYFAALVNADGCAIHTPVREIIIGQPVPGIRYPDVYAPVNIPFPLAARQLGSEVTWNPATFLNDRSTYTPVFSGTSDQLYTIAITTTGGCVTIDTQLVKTIPKIDILVPTAFTPDGNGLNDRLHPILFGITKLTFFRIFNRLGQPLFQTSDPAAGWDGTFKGLPLQSQVVVWMAAGIGADHKIYERKGASLLVR